MRLLDRYLLRELLIPLGFCLCGFLILWITSDLFNQLGDFQKHNLTFGDVGEYYLVKTPEFLVLILPIGLLLALLYTLTNHARHNELTAIRAAGVSLWRICAPYFIVGFLFSAAMFAMNELWVPNTTEMAEQILSRRSETNAVALNKDIQRSFVFQNARDKRTWFAETYDLKNHVLTGASVDWILPDGSRRRVLAKRAEYASDAWTFHDAQEYRAEPGVGAYLIPFQQTNTLTVPEFTETPGQFKREINIAKRLVQLSAHSAELPIVDILDYLDLHPGLSSGNKWWLYTQLHGRMAMPWTCVVVVLIAIPFGAASGRRNVFVGVASSIVICFGYFILLRLGLALGTGGYVPAWIGAWLPNVAFGVAGVWMMLRVR